MALPPAVNNQITDVAKTPADVSSKPADDAAAATTEAKVSDDKSGPVAAAEDQR